MKTMAMQRIEDDETVIEALRQGRLADDIWLIDCPWCGVPSYYNEGFHCTCRICGREIGQYSDEARTLADYWEMEPYPSDQRSE